MIEPSTIRSEVANILNNYLGEYLYPDGSSRQAIAVLPDPDLGWNYPEEGVRASGLECTIIQPIAQPSALIGGGACKEFCWEIHLKQWDSGKDLINPSEELVNFISITYLLKRFAYMPANNKLMTIEQYKIYFCEYEVFT